MIIFPLVDVNITVERKRDEQVDTHTRKKTFMASLCQMCERATSPFGKETPYIMLRGDLNKAV